MYHTAVRRAYTFLVILFRQYVGSKVLEDPTDRCLLIHGASPHAGASLGEVAPASLFGDGAALAAEARVRVRPSAWWRQLLWAREQNDPVRAMGPPCMTCSPAAVDG